MSTASMPQNQQSEVSGSGAMATTGGVAAGEKGIAVGGHVLGSIVQVVNFITMAGGIDDLAENILRDLGKQINDSPQAASPGPEAVMHVIQSHVEARMGKGSASNLIDYLQIAGQTFGTLVDKYESIEADKFPFGDFLQDTVKMIGANSDFTQKAFDSFCTDRQAINCKDVGLVFAAPLRYRSLELPELNRSLGDALRALLPHPGPLYLCRKTFPWAAQDVWLGQQYQQGNVSVICPIQMTGRELVAHQWRVRIDHVFFHTLTTSLLADFVLYLDRIRTGENTVKQVLATLRELGSQSTPSNQQS